MGTLFPARLKAFLDDADQHFRIRVRKTGAERDPFKAQLWHVAHMFYWNSFKHRHPRPFEWWEGDRVIKFEHAQNPNLVFGSGWAHGVRWQDFLRDKQGQVPLQKRDGSRAWEPGREPDQDQSREQAYKILERVPIATAHHTRSHGAMVAPGFDHCGQPCNCGGMASKHTANKAVDLDMQDLQRLETLLRRQEEDTLDKYLLSFGLHRPMLHGPPSWAEPWHIEATPA